MAYHVTIYFIPSLKNPENASVGNARKKGDVFIALKAKRQANKYINTILVSLDAKMSSQYSTQ